eukprot:CAMPEP_0170399480 /NCGR_PEP_ID=MMETSP0117_2-20130122/23980_1 /TAXON_ID=400756 /ORGANISM="Durinskia baltica, Strain CSIRO CS-38" /LENGTH=259 /DNA_ID=CAMNT_0010656151 /DNA_START=1 /DNA_END=776 /DNA_ORIENTATION=-
MPVPCARAKGCGKGPGLSGPGTHKWPGSLVDAHDLPEDLPVDPPLCEEQQPESDEVEARGEDEAIEAEALARRLARGLGGQAIGESEPVEDEVCHVARDADDKGPLHPRVEGQRPASGLRRRGDAGEDGEGPRREQHATARLFVCIAAQGAVRLLPQGEARLGERPPREVGAHAVEAQRDRRQYPCDQARDVDFLELLPAHGQEDLLHDVCRDLRDLLGVLVGVAVIAVAACLRPSLEREPAVLKASAKQPSSAGARRG